MIFFDVIKNQNSPRSYKIKGTDLMKRINLAFLIVIVLCSFSLHEYYISIMDGERVKGDFQLSVRVDLEDVTTLVKSKYKIIPFLGEENENIKVDSMLVDYLKNHFFVIQNQKKYMPTWVGKEVEEDLLWIYFTLESPELDQPFTMTNTLLFDYFDDQVNVVRLKAEGYKKNAYFKTNQPTFEFKP